MKSITNTLLKLLTVLLLTAATSKAEEPDEAAELIRQAHEHDNMYTLGPEASQQKALSLYQSALAAEPDRKQRLHILHRMAQLNGSAYQLEKGEKPDFQEAIKLYKEIINSYPKDEPLVYKAMSSISSHYTTLREFEKAIEWSKKVLEYDTSAITRKLEVIEKLKETIEQQGDSITGQQRHLAAEQIEKAYSLRKVLDKIKRYQVIAVDQVAYTANIIDPTVAIGELGGIAQKHAGTFIADRAAVHIRETTARMKKYLVPGNEEFPTPSDQTLHANVTAPIALSQTNKGALVQSDIIPEVTENRNYAEPNTTEVTQKEKYVSRNPRAPPGNYLLKCIISAAGLIFFSLVAIIIIKKGNFF
jgi:tetratricopeptide (TPR) repeat protein